MKKNDGAAPGMVSASSRRRLPWMLATATSTVRPRPSESTTLRVGAPGPARSASARRAMPVRRRASQRASAMIAKGQQAKDDDGGKGRQHEPEGEHPIVGREDRQRDQRGQHEGEPQDVGPAPPERAAGWTMSRNSWPGGKSRVRIRAGSEKASATSRPKPAASSSARG